MNFFTKEFPPARSTQIAVVVVPVVSSPRWPVLVFCKALFVAVEAAMCLRRGLWGSQTRKIEKKKKKKKFRDLAFIFLLHTY